jgi:hypothetical protein
LPYLTELSRPAKYTLRELPTSIRQVDNVFLFYVAELGDLEHVTLVTTIDPETLQRVAFIAAPLRICTTSTNSVFLGTSAPQEMHFILAPLSIYTDSMHATGGLVALLKKNCSQR